MSIRFFTILDLKTLNKISSSGHLVGLPLRKEQLLAERKAFENLLKDSNVRLVYGVHTGFGPHALVQNDSLELVQKSLVYHLTVEPIQDLASIPSACLSHKEARAVLAARIHSLSLGGSGIRYETLELLNELLRLDCIPVLPEKGSLSASGDLIPLSYIPLALMGESFFTGSGASLLPNRSNQTKSLVPGIPWSPQAKEAISLTNGTSFTTALLGLQLEEIERVWNHTLYLLGYFFSFHAIFPDAFHPLLHDVKTFDAPKRIASLLYPIVAANPKKKSEGRRTQDIYSIRCLPQIFGAHWEEWLSLKKIVEAELNSLSDNPVLVSDQGNWKLLEGGGFFASQISFAADRLQNLMANWATWLDRFLQYVYDPKENDEFPLMLSPKPGTFAGLSGLGLMATHLTAEIRRDSNPGSIQSLSTNGNNQDITPMGSISVLRNRRTMKSIWKLLTILAYSIRQASYYASKKTSVPDVLARIPKLEADRSLMEEIQSLELELRSNLSLVSFPVD